MDMTLKEIFESVAIKEPLAQPVWQQLLQAFPRDHFSLIIKQIAESLEDSKDETYDQMIQIVKEGIGKSTRYWERALENVRDQNKQYFDDLEELRKEMQAFSIQKSEQLEQQEKDLTDMHTDYLEKELDKVRQQNEIDKKRSEKEREHLIQEVDRQKRSKEHVDLKIALFKWRQSGVFLRYYEQIRDEHLDKHSLRGLMQQDLRKLFLSSDLLQLKNSLRQSQTLQKSAEQQLKQFQSENYSLRMKINRMLTNHQEINWQLEKHLIRENDLNHRIDQLQRKLNEANIAKNQSIERANNLNKILLKQIELKEMYEDKLKLLVDEQAQQAGLSKPPIEGEDAEKKEKDRLDLRQKQTKRIIAGFKIELKSLLWMNQENISKRILTTQDINYKQKTAEIGSQTELQGIVSRKFDLKIMYDRPFKIQNSEPTACEQGNQTQISSNIIDFLASGCKTYEILLKYNMVRPSDEPDDADLEETEEQYIDRLHTQEKNDGSLFIKRQKYFRQKKFSNEIQSAHLDLPFSQKSAASLMRKRGKQNKMVVEGEVQETISEQTSQNSQSQRLSASFSKNKKDKNRQLRLSQSNNPKKTENVLIASASSGSQLQQIKESGAGFRMKPKLNTKKRKSQNSDASNFAQSISQSSSNSELVKSRNSELFQESGQGVRISRSPYIYVQNKEQQQPIVTEKDLDYRKMAQQKNAVSLFEAYMQAYEVMTKLEPKLFKTAVQTIKKYRSFNLNIPQVKRLKNLYPDLLPDVFYRLFVHSPSGKEKLLQEEIIKDAKEAWHKKLNDCDLLDEVEDDEILHQLQPIKPIKSQLKKVVHRLNSNKTQNDRMTPLKNTLTLSNSSLRDQQYQQTYESLSQVLQPMVQSVKQNQRPKDCLWSPRVATETPNKSKATNNAEKVQKILDSQPQQVRQVEETKNCRSSQIMEAVQKLDSAIGQEGFYSLPNSAYEMKVQVNVPKKRTLSSRYRKGKIPQNSNQHVTETQSWHLMVPQDKQQATKPSRLPQNSTTCMVNSHRYIGNVFDQSQNNIVYVQSSRTTQATPSQVKVPSRSNNKEDQCSQVGSLSSRMNNSQSLRVASQLRPSRPYTCRPGASQRQRGNETFRQRKNSASKYSTNTDSNLQYLLKQNPAIGTVANTIATTRTQKSQGDHEIIKNKDQERGSASCFLSNMVTQDSMAQVKKKRFSAANPVKVININQFPHQQSSNDWQNQRDTCKNMMSPLQNVSIKGKTALRAQSATHNKPRRPLQHGNTVVPNSDQQSIQETLHAMAVFQNSHAFPSKNGKRVAIKLAPSIHVKSEEQLELENSKYSQSDQLQPSNHKITMNSGPKIIPANINVNIQDEYEPKIS